VTHCVIHVVAQRIRLGPVGPVAAFHALENTGVNADIRAALAQTVHQRVIAEVPALLSQLWRYALVLSGFRTGAQDLVQLAWVRALEQPAPRLLRSFLSHGAGGLSHHRCV
jgi:hypothetical protein